MNQSVASVVYRGSRKHVLDWTGQTSFLQEFAQLLAPVEIQVDGATRFMPRGYEAPAEARLDQVGHWLLPDVNPDVWNALRDWWLVHKRGANTPNWDIAVGCSIAKRPGLVLVEAKANWSELGTAGKSLSSEASLKSRENHERIGLAIGEACRGWQAIDKRVSISRDTHYQLANRLAFTWKLARLGVPTVLVYLGFTGDDGIRDAGEPFADDHDWGRALEGHVAGIVPSELFDRPIAFGGHSAWLVSRGRAALAPSPRICK